MTKSSPFPLVPVALDDFPRAGWRWQNFTPEEVACKNGQILIHPPTLDKLQRLRNRIGAPLVIRSAYRTPEYNAKLPGAAPGSMHLCARAFDVSMSGHDPHEFERQARAAGFTGFGFYPEDGFMHIDTGPAREWGTRWPAYEDEAPEPPPMAKVLSGKDAAEALAEVGRFFGTGKRGLPGTEKHKATCRA